MEYSNLLRCTSSLRRLHTHRTDCEIACIELFTRSYMFYTYLFMSTHKRDTET